MKIDITHCPICGADFTRERSLKRDTQIHPPFPHDSVYFDTRNKKTYYGHADSHNEFQYDESKPYGLHIHGALKCTSCGTIVKDGILIRRYAYLPEDELPLHIMDTDRTIREIVRYRLSHPEEVIEDLLSFSTFVLDKAWRDYIRKFITS